MGPSSSVYALEEKEVSCCVANRTTYPRSFSPWLSPTAIRTVSARCAIRAICVYLLHCNIITAATMGGGRVYRKVQGKMTIIKRRS